MLKIKKKYLLIIAGIIWLIAGINILRIGILAILSTLKTNLLWQNITLPIFSLLILVGFSFMFRRIINKNELRIMAYESEKVSIFRFFDLKGYITIIFMMGLGIILRRGNYLSEYFFSFFYTGLGTALSIAGITFIVHFFKLTVRQILWLILGFTSIGLGTLGIFVPILPTVPLYLLGSFSFLSSSQKLYNKFLESRIYKRFLKPYITAGGLTKKAKIILILSVSLQFLIAFFIVKKSIVAICILSILYICFLICIIFVVKTITKTDDKK